MTDYLPKDVSDALALARANALRRNKRLRVVAGDQSWPILRIWQGGFALDAETAPHLRGLVQVQDGTRLMFEALIVTASEEGRELCFEYKRSTAARDSAPLDYPRADHAPFALLGRQPAAY
jgi:hypothetical protein